MAIHRQVKEIERQHCSSYSDTTGRAFKPLRTELRAVTIFAIMLVMFAGCWITFYVAAFTEYLVFPFNVPEILLSTFDFLRFSTSLINPILYIFLKHDFREALVFPCNRRRNIARRPKYHISQGTTTTAVDTKLWSARPSDHL